MINIENYGIQWSKSDIGTNPTYFPISFTNQMYACAGVDTVGIMTNDVSSGLRYKDVKSKESATFGPSILKGMCMMYIGI